MVQPTRLFLDWYFANGIICSEKSSAVLAGVEAAADKGVLAIADVHNDLGIVVVAGCEFLMLQEEARFPRVNNRARPETCIADVPRCSLVCSSGSTVVLGFPNQGCEQHLFLLQRPLLILLRALVCVTRSSRSAYIHDAARE